MALYIREGSYCIAPNASDDKAERPGVRDRGKAGKADILLAVCYRSLNQDEDVGELFYKQLAGVSPSSALVLVGDFNLLDTCWKLNTEERRQSKKFAEVHGKYLPDTAGKSLSAVRSC